MSRAGRKRNTKAAREASGKVQRVYVSERRQVASQPHRMAVPLPHREDDRAETVFGRLMLNGYITPAMYEAGRRYADGAAAVRRLLDCPSPHPRAMDMERLGGRSEGPDKTREEIKAINDRHDKAFEAIGANRVQRVVNAHAIWDKPADPESLPQLKIGLLNLVRHYGLDERLQITHRPK